ncbi:hypothetical protein D3C78_1125800 [compost metagenome]
MLIQADGFSGAQNRNQIDVWRIKSGGQYRDVHQIAELLRFKGFDERIAFRAGCFTGNQRGVVFRQQTGDFAGMFHGGGENHHAFACLSKLFNLADDMWRNALLLFQLQIHVRFAK